MSRQLTRHEKQLIKPPSARIIQQTMGHLCARLADTFEHDKLLQDTASFFGATIQNHARLKCPYEQYRIELQTPLSTADTPEQAQNLFTLRKQWLGKATLTLTHPILATIYENPRSHYDDSSHRFSIAQYTCPTECSTGEMFGQSDCELPQTIYNQPDVYYRISNNCTEHRLELFRRLLRSNWLSIERD